MTRLLQHLKGMIHGGKIHLSPGERPEPPKSTGKALDRLMVLAAMEPGIKFINSHNSSAQIADRAGLTYCQTLRHLNGLITQGRVRRIGKTCGARYRKL